jgi:hypothetical protein
MRPIVLIRHLDTVTTRRLALYMVGLDALVYAVYAALGVRFDISSLTQFWQYLDPVLLKTRLIESVFYLHSQPPLFNLFLGLVLKLAPDDPAPLFRAAYFLAGLALYLGLFGLMRRLGVSRPLALALSTLFMARPAFILYEHWLYYTFPLAAILTLSALAVAEFLEHRRPWQAAAFFALLFLLCATRSLFQWLYFVFILAALLIARRRDWRVILATAAIPLLLLLALNFKNYVLFGKFTSATWLGLNVWGMVDRDLPQAERGRLVAEGRLSELALISRFSPVEAYPPRYRAVTGYENIPALRQTRKSTDAINYNHLAYIGISDQHLADSFWVITHRPRCFLYGVAKAWFLYFWPSSEYSFLAANRSQLGALIPVLNYVAYGKLPFDLTQVRGLPLHTDGERYIYLFLLIGLPAVLIYGVWRALDPRNDEPINRRLLLLLVCFNIAFVALIGNLFEVGENNRFRFMTDPLSAALLGMCIQRWLIGRTKRSLRK